MRLAGRRALAVWASLALLTSNLGCAARMVASPSGSEQMGTQLGTIGVASASFLPEAEYWAPQETKKGAARGLSKGAKIGAVVGFVPGFILGTALTGKGGEPAGYVSAAGGALVGAPIGAALGALNGATKDPPAEAVRKAEADLRGLLPALKVQEALRDHVVQFVQDQGQQLRLLPEHGPTAQDRDPTYRVLANEGIDTVLERLQPCVG